MGADKISQLKRRAYNLVRICLCAVMIGCGLFSLPSFAQEGRYISSQDVYENPDDHDLSLEYAKQQIKRGEMLDAGAALERMLYSNPNWHSARLLYAAVLYRLDDQKAALRELSLLEKKELNADQEATHKRYQKAFQIPPRPSLLAQTTAAPAGPRKFLSFTSNSTDKIKGSVTLGIRGDDNAGNALTDEGFGFDDQGDVSAVADAQIRLRHAISANGNVTVHADARALIRRHETFSRADYGVYDLSVGLNKKVNNSQVGVALDARRVNVSEEKYLEQLGPRISVASRISDTTRVTASLAAYWQDYSPLSFAALEDERDGIKTSLQVGVLKKIKDSQRLNIVVGHDTKSAEISAFAYDGPVLGVSFENKFDSDYIFKASARLRQLNFNDSLVANIDKRRDTRLAARAALGSSIQNILPGSKKADLYVELGLNYNNRDSNIEANDFKNIGADMRLTFGF